MTHVKTSLFILIVICIITYYYYHQLDEIEYPIMKSIY